MGISRICVCVRMRSYVCTCLSEWCGIIRVHGSTFVAADLPFVCTALCCGEIHKYECFMTTRFYPRPILRPRCPAPTPSFSWAIVTRHHCKMVFCVFTGFDHALALERTRAANTCVARRAVICVCLSRALVRGSCVYLAFNNSSVMKQYRQRSLMSYVYAYICVWVSSDDV